MENLKRIGFEIIVTVIITLLFLTKVYELAENPTQLILLKINLVSMGFLHAHIVGKLLFRTKLEWNVPWEMASMAHVVRGFLYVTTPFMYAIGG